MENLSWFKVRKIAKKVWLIEDIVANFYLIEGNEKALLIDTGWGTGDLPGLVSTLTSLPLIIVNTHGHPDHVDGNYHFHNVYIHSDDVAMMEQNFTCEVRLDMLNRYLRSNLPEGFSEQLWVNAKMCEYTPFKGPRSFDLGGRSVDIIEIPGHTPGSICLYDHNDRLLFTGDSVSEGLILLHFDGCLPLKTFLDGVNKLVAMIDRIDYIVPSYGRSTVEPFILSDLQRGIERILSGEIRGEPHETYQVSGQLCKFKSCGLIYREDNLW